MNINRERLGLWLDDLRTTEEPQTRGHLHVADVVEHEDPVGFCCLGRWCEVAMANGADIEATREPVDEDDPSLGLGSHVYYDNCSELPPSSLSDWLELDHNHAKNFYHVAAAWNDTDGLTFKEIADKAEAWFEDHS